MYLSTLFFYLLYSYVCLSAQHPAGEDASPLLHPPQKRHSPINITEADSSAHAEDMQSVLQNSLLCQGDLPSSHVCEGWENFEYCYTPARPGHIQRNFRVSKSQNMIIDIPQSWRKYSGIYKHRASILTRNKDCMDNCGPTLTTEPCGPTRGIKAQDLYKHLIANKAHGNHHDVIIDAIFPHYRVYCDDYKKKSPKFYLMGDMGTPITFALQEGGSSMLMTLPEGATNREITAMFSWTNDEVPHITVKLSNFSDDMDAVMPFLAPCIDPTYLLQPIDHLDIAPTPPRYANASSDRTIATHLREIHRFELTKDNPQTAAISYSPDFLRSFTHVHENPITGTMQVSWDQMQSERTALVCTLPSRLEGENANLTLQFYALYKDAADAPTQTTETKEVSLSINPFACVVNHQPLYELSPHTNITLSYHYFSTPQGNTIAMRLPHAINQKGNYLTVHWGQTNISQITCSLFCISQESAQNNTLCTLNIPRWQTLLYTDELMEK